MRRLLRPRLLAAAAVVGLLASAAATSSGAGPAAAHGSTQRPPSRYYSCRFENPTNPMCATAWSADAQALYDWMEVNIGDAGGRHQELIADGRLCSANRDKYAAFDAPGNWPVTNLQPNGAGLVDIAYTSTAPHATAYYRFYLTRDGFDARSDSLSWGDLELMHDSGPLAAAPQPRFQVPLPTRSTPAILYVIWQRNDSNEAFYACSDVTVGAAPAPGAAAPSAAAPAAASPVTVASLARPPAVVGSTPAAPPAPVTPVTSATSPAASATVPPKATVELAQAPPATAESPLAVTEPSAATAPPATAAPSAVVSATSVPVESAAAAAPNRAGAAEAQSSSGPLLLTVTAILTVAGLIGLTWLLAPPVGPVPAWIRAQRPDRPRRRARTIG